MSTDPIPKTSGGVELRTDVISHDIVRGILDDPLREKFYNPLDGDEDTTERLKRTRELWAREGFTTVFTSGAFDLMHLNHAAFLLRVKLEAAPLHFARYHAGGVHLDWDALSQEVKHVYCLEILEKGELKLVVSVDGDKALNVRKKDKGGGERPIYSWVTRANEVLRVTAETKPGIYKPIVDAVTVHDNQLTVLQGTPHDDIMSIAHYLQPDVWSVYQESQDVLDSLDGGEATDFPNTQVVVMSPHEYYTDELLGGKFSTTKIARRLGSAALPRYNI